MMDNIKWIFFDIGSTLVDESKCYEKRYAEAVENTDITYEEFENKVIEFAKQNLKGDHEAVKYYNLALPKWHKELEFLYPEAKTVLKSLKEKNFKIGIIANQSLGSEERLRNWDILEYLDIVVASAEEGVAKPDLKIFEIALKRADCKPQDAVMIGDRLDNDICPANKIGMKTIWIRQGFGKYSTP
ncbi:MAG: HAD-IIIA family hydrolase, partial [Eubacterium sp.]|nr:HAD-IIIA family hydrolase [Eubacterium sp.]